jgi:hypothetical protein
MLIVSETGGIRSLLHPGAQAMIDPKFLEAAPLYKKYPYQGPNNLGKMEGEFDVRIKMFCYTCGSDQTFQRCGAQNCQVSVRKLDRVKDRNPSDPISSNGSINVGWFLCANCGAFGYGFLVRISDDGQKIEKVGQYPPWSIDPHPYVKEAAAEHLDIYKKGLINESQGYGIGAYAYYRRIVELVIDGLLDDIGKVMEGMPGHDAYVAKLKEVKEDHQASNKIEVVKDLLPPHLSPGGRNPLGIIHRALSQGIHSDSDEECVELAGLIRESLVFLLETVSRQRKSAAGFTANIDAIQKKLDKKN